MTDKELRRLSKSDLLDIIYELQKSEKKLAEKNRELEERLASKELKISSAGSIAEAAFAVNGVIEAVQAAADQYLDQIKATTTVTPVTPVTPEKTNDNKAQAEADQHSEQIENAAAAPEDASDEAKNTEDMIAEAREMLKNISEKYDKVKHRAVPKPKR